MDREFSKKKYKCPMNMKNVQFSGKSKLKQDHLFPFRLAKVSKFDNTQC